MLSFHVYMCVPQIQVEGQTEDRAKHNVPIGVESGEVAFPFLRLQLAEIQHQLFLQWYRACGKQLCFDVCVCECVCYSMNFLAETQKK